MVNILRISLLKTLERRSICLTPSPVALLSKCLDVYKRQVYVTEDMVGHKLGEFVATRTYRGHGKDEKKSKVR